MVLDDLDDTDPDGAKPGDAKPGMSEAFFEALTSVNGIGGLLEYTVPKTITVKAAA